MLRALPTRSSVMADTVKLWWAWRKNTERAFLPSVIVVILALVFVITTIAASIFSSLIVTTGSIEVLVESPLCGGISNSGMTNGTSGSFTRPTYSLAPSYADLCYKCGLSLKACDYLPQPNIPTTVRDAPCPFRTLLGAIPWSQSAWIQDFWTSLRPLA
jgi:hypothetical protein